MMTLGGCNDWWFVINVKLFSEKFTYNIVYANWFWKEGHHV